MNSKAINSDLLALVNRFPHLRVAVIGEAMLDIYAHGDVARICREAPVPVVTLSEEEHVPGGAANTAANLVSLGAQTYFLSVVGDDPEGLLLRRALEKAGVSTKDLLVDPSRRTLVKRRIIGSNQMLLRIDQGDIETLEGAVERALIHRLDSLFEQVDAVVVSDY
ncbi:MAG TPA: PfkB family carbohydrate kinase, partial [Anaerolineae bacterium]|nr:PfkB family carbohydrate kinase [Anaerolineae bacterium]